MIEAMACATPVIAYRSGSVPEVVEDGVTGFIVENEEEAVAAVRNMKSAPPTVAKTGSIKANHTMLACELVNEPADREVLDH
jgi:glycosyltransferase involved in cell wall biosynthesis